MRQLAALVDGTDILLIGDEVYEHIIFDGRRHESLLRYPDLRERAVVISSFGKTFHTTGWKVGLLRGAAGPDRRGDARAPVRDVHGAHAVADRVRRVRAPRPVARRTWPGSTSASATCSCELIAGSRFKPLPCGGTYFQLIDYSAISKETATRTSRTAPDQRARRRVDPGLGVPLQGHRRPGAAILLREEGRDAARGGRAAAGSNGI